MNKHKRGTYMRKRSQSGFSTPLLILAVVVAVAIAVAGYYVWQKNKNTTQTSNTTQDIQTQEPQKTEDQKPEDPTEGGKYLVISEWNIRIPLSESLQKDITYGIRNRQSIPTSVASFEVGKLASLPQSNCKLHQEDDGTGKSGGIGVMLMREHYNSPKPDGVGDAIFTSSDKQYKYYATHLKALCAPTEEQLQLNIGDDLTNALTQIQEIH